MQKYYNTGKAVLSGLPAHLLQSYVALLRHTFLHLASRPTQSNID